MVNKQAAKTKNIPDFETKLEFPEIKYQLIAKHKKTLFRDINSYSILTEHRISSYLLLVLIKIKQNE